MMHATRRFIITQIVIVVLWESANQILTYLVAPQESYIGIANAHRLVNFERSHGFFVEPAWQQFVLQSHTVLGVPIPWRWQVDAANALYALGHPLITLAVGLWLLFARPAIFPFFRNVIIGADILALVGYKVYPTAPPRLTPGLAYNGAPFHFVDTAIYWFASEGHQYGAMPSIHMAYSTTVALTLAWAIRPLLPRLLLPLYPIAMLVAVVATANHYFMDAVGSLGVLCIARPVAFLLHWLGTQHEDLAAQKWRAILIRVRSRFA
jgi:hypothetical protein